MTLRETGQISGDIYYFSFEPERHYGYIAGQFAEFTIAGVTDDPKGPRRWFTISSSPTEQLVTITVRMRQPLSSFKQALRSLQLGEAILSSDPLGDFVLPLDESRPLVWLAAGIGITPFGSMARWIVDSGERRSIRLLHISNNPGGAALDQLLDAASIKHQTISTIGTRPDAPAILAGIPAIADNSLVYISGPENMANDIRASLLGSGYDRDMIIVDQFLGYDI